MRFIALMLAVALLAGCAAADEADGASPHPGSATISLHGRVETGFGAAIR
jgi:uncharacterized protein YceK